jgi:transcriptional regulator with XRE-family HTH domain
MDLALDVGISPRHLSFIETGRSRPSGTVLMALAENLSVPLRERNRMLLAAGYAPRYSQQSLDDAGMSAVRAALERLLQAHAPYPGLVLDRHWNVILANAPAMALAAVLPAFLSAPTLNILRASLHPQGFASITANFSDWAHHLLHGLQRAIDASGDPMLLALQKEVRGYPNVLALAAVNGRAAEPGAATGLLVPCVLDLPAGRVSMFSTLTTFGTPRDITLDELCVELFYPADAESEKLLRGVS